jgi:uncharacterized protein with PQ loop repeat
VSDHILVPNQQSASNNNKMTLSTLEVIMEYVCPTAGVILGTLMFMAPLRDAHKAAKIDGDLHHLNPTPWAFTLGNCFGWIVYSMLIHNYFVFVGNAPGFLIGIYLNIQACKLQYHSHRLQKIKTKIFDELQEADEENRSHLLLQDDVNEMDSTNTMSTTTSSASVPIDYEMLVWKSSISKEQQHEDNPKHHELLVYAMIIFWMTVACFVQFGGHKVLSSNTQEWIIGIIVNANCTFFYAAPLSTIWNVLKTRTTKTIHIPTMIMNTANALFWMTYGFAIVDPFLFGPNALGSFFGFTQIFLCLIFPRDYPKQEEDDDEANTNMAVIGGISNASVAPEEIQEQDATQVDDLENQ